MINPLYFAMWFWSLALDEMMVDLAVATGRQKPQLVLIVGGKR